MVVGKRKTEGDAAASAKKQKLDEIKTINEERNKEHKKTVEMAKGDNIVLKQKGKVSCNKLPHYRSKVVKEKRWPNKGGYKNINCCSGAPGIFKELSPMKVGPIAVEDDFTNGKVKVTNVENLWQFSKVWDGETDAKGNPTLEFFKRRKEGWKNPKGQRWVKKGTGANPNKPKYLYWKGKHLSYLEARKEVYCPAYAAGVVKTKAYKELLSLLDQGYNLQILGYDGYDYQTEGKTLEACLNDTTRPFGHELVLVCLLTNQRVWEKKVKKQADGKVKNIDKEEVENEKVDNIDNGEIEDGKKEVEE